MDLSKHNNNWEKLEEALKSSEPPQVNESILKSRKISSHPSYKPPFNLRSKSSCKESPSKFSRPQTSSTSLYKSFSANTFEPLTYIELQLIYSSKCQDLQIPVIPEQEKRFFNYCQSNFRARKFSLKESGLGLNSARTIGEILKNNPNFAYLNLSKNNLKDEGFIILTKHLKKSTSLVHLDVSSNEIYTEGNEQGLTELIGHPSLASLNLCSHEGMHRNRIGVPGSRVLIQLIQSNPVLSFLNLAGTGLGVEGVEVLIESLKSNKTLLALNLANNAIGTRTVEHLAEIVTNTAIKELNLALNKLGNDACEALGLMLSGGFGKPAELTKLDLSENEISTSGISKIFAALRINAHLTCLNISRNCFSKGLSQNLLQFLMENVSLNSLNLSFCSLKCESLFGLSEGLGKNAGIKVLNLSNNFIEDRGCEQIAFGLSKNKGIEVLDLSSNRIKDKGGVALAKAAKMNSSLNALLLKDNSVKDGTGHILSDVTRTKTNLARVSLELNPINLKYVQDISMNLKNNVLTQQKMIVPKLQEALGKININNSAMEYLQSKIENKQKEKQEIEQKLKTQGQRLEQFSLLEAEKLKELKDEHQELKLYSQKLSLQIDELNTQIYKMRLLTDKDSNDWSDKIGRITLEVKKLEKHSKRYSGLKIKEERNLKKSQTFAVIKQFKDELEIVESRKKNEESVIYVLKKKMEERKKIVEGIKNPKPEERKGFLASEKLASEKKHGSLSPVKSRGFKVWSPSKNKRTSSTMRNK